MGADLERIETELRGSVLSEDEYLTELASHLILAGGKRIRPVLAMASAATNGDAVSHAVVMGAVSVELVHLGSLYHDDVMDEAVMRRQVPSVNARWGNLKAILAGDFLLARASEIAASLGTEVAGLLAATIAKLCRGQISELRTTFDPSRTERAYFECIDGKTASLFGTACRIGAIVGGLDRTKVDQLTTYGSALGVVFQIVDDLLDLTSTDSQLGKPAGHDMVEGVYSLPVIRTLARSDAAASELRDLLGEPLGGAELDKALGIVRTGPGLGEALEVARRYAHQARDMAMAVGSSSAADAMAAAPLHLLDTLPEGVG
ncbi:MAG: putative polyprenyl diphosphate synthase [Acidimicrobiia bacterium]|nr:putative polyprenyl diphosphate synthase [Acidimicrobiia bacterium]